MLMNPFSSMLPAFEPDAANPECRDLGNEVERELIAHPIVLDDRRDFSIHEIAPV